MILGIDVDDETVGRAEELAAICAAAGDVLVSGVPGWGRPPISLLRSPTRCLWRS